MSESMPDRVCDLCGREQPCSVVSFYPVSEDKAAPTPYTGSRGISIPNQFYLNCCEDCGREKGTASKTPWILTLLGYVLLIGGILLVSLPQKVTGLRPSAGWPIIPMMIGWMMTVFAPMALILRLRNECGNGKIGLLIGLQFVPVVGLIALLANAGKINRSARAVSALKTVATQRLLQEKQKDEELERLAENGAALTEEQRKQIEERRKEKEDREKMDQYAREAQQERVNRSNFRGAIIGIIITILLAIVGISTYSSGRGYMTFFGIRLSPGGFAGLIGAFLVWDIISIVNAKKKM